MPREFGSTQLFIDTAYIRGELERLNIDPWFGPTELLRPLRNLHIDEKDLSIRRVVFYDAIDEQAATAEIHRNYLAKLRQLPDTLVRLGSVVGVRNKRQKTVDMQIGMDMVQAAQSGLVEYIALASGDADFIPAVQRVQDLGPKVLVLAFQGSVSKDLTGEADRYIALPENADRIWAIR